MKIPYEWNFSYADLPRLRLPALSFVPVWSDGAVEVPDNALQAELDALRDAINGFDRLTTDEDGRLEDAKKAADLARRRGDAQTLKDLSARLAAIEMMLGLVSGNPPLGPIKKE